MSNYYQDALDAAARGDRKAAEAALAKREEKMNSSSYTGNGGGTSMSQARDEINRILSSGSSKSTGSSGGSGSTSPAANGETSFKGISYTNSSNGGGMYSAPSSNSDVKRYTQGGVNYQTGANMQRRPDLAGKYAISNGYTVFYDENGYATHAVKGEADYTPHQDEYAKNGTYGTNGAWTDQELLTAEDRQKIAALRERMRAGEITSDEANRAANAIRAGYGYSIDRGGYVTDYGALSKVNDQRQKLGLSTDGTESTGQQYWRYLMETDTSNGMPSYEEWAAQNGVDGYQNSDYQNALYAAQKEESLSKLGESSSSTSTTTTGGGLSGDYEAARNLAQAKNDIERRNFQEYAAAYGLNSGVSGQAELSQSAALQSALADINVQEARAKEQQRQTELAQRYQQAQEEAAARQQAEAEAAKPSLTASQAQTAAKNGLRTSVVQQAFDYYFGDGAFASLYGGGASAQSGAAGSSGTGTKKASSKSSGYNNGSLTTDQVKKLQSYYGVTADGLWGKNSKEAAGGLSADEAWAQYSTRSGNHSGYTTADISGYESQNGSGSFARKLASEDPYVSRLMGNLATMPGDSNKLRRYASIKEYYELGYINDAEAAYLLDRYSATGSTGESSVRRGSRGN